jgi:hypothetical protein
MRPGVFSCCPPPPLLSAETATLDPLSLYLSTLCKVVYNALLNSPAGGGGGPQNQKTAEPVFVDVYGHLGIDSRNRVYMKN